MPFEVEKFTEQPSPTLTSITKVLFSIDVDLLEKAGILPYERVDVLNVDNGERLTTYAIEGGPGEFCLNGAAAHKGAAGQKIIICTYTWLDEDELGLHKPKVVLLGDGNKVKKA